MARTLCSTIAAAVFFIGREDFRARAVAQVLSAAQLCKREPADGADVFRQR